MMVSSDSDRQTMCGTRPLGTLKLEPIQSAQTQLFWMCAGTEGHEAGLEQGCTICCFDRMEAKVARLSIFVPMLGLGFRG